MELITKSIRELLEYNFNIPDYQRGYRWEEQNVIDLLDDLQEYRDLVLQFTAALQRGLPHNECSEYYCLQPIVVKKNKRLSEEKGKPIYDVIDGQQRLTTLFLILSTFDDKVKDIFNQENVEFFSLSYDRGLEDYLTERKYQEDQTLWKSNANAFFIKKAYETICTRESDAKKIISALLGTEEVQDKFITKVIWYDLSGTAESSIEIFTRLNKGKIGLTDAELIKALLFESDRYINQEVRKKEIIKMAGEWDNMERALKNDSFWSFVAPIGYEPSSRISLILHKVARELNTYKEIKAKNFSEEKDNFDYHVIDAFLKIRSCNGVADTASTADAVDVLWGKIQDVFSVFQNWYSDREFYHLIGYLTIFSDRDYKLIDSLFAEYRERKTKKEFRAFLKTKVAEKINFDLDKLSYPGKDIFRMLLLFNIDTMIKNGKEGARYPFQMQRMLNISSLEHIHPQNLDDEIENSESCFSDKVKPWADSKLDILQTALGKDLRSLPDAMKEDDMRVLRALVEDGYDYYNQNFYAVKETIGHIDKVFRDFIELTDEEMHSIRNMALVTKEDNSALGNGFLDEKRAKIKELCNDPDKYIPVCTRMVFNKEFSDSTNMKFWDKSDRDAYYAAIKAVYDSYKNV